MGGACNVVITLGDQGRVRTDENGKTSQIAAVSGQSDGYYSRRKFVGAWEPHSGANNIGKQDHQSQVPPERSPPQNSARAVGTDAWRRSLCWDAQRNEKLRRDDCHCDDCQCEEQVLRRSNLSAILQSRCVCNDTCSLSWIVQVPPK